MPCFLELFVGSDEGVEDLSFLIALRVALQCSDVNFRINRLRMKSQKLMFLNERGM